MANELAFVLINPYTIAKSRTGGVIARYIARADLNLVAARMFGPSRELVERYADAVRKADPSHQTVRDLLADYILRAYSPDPTTGRPRRVMFLLFEGENAVAKIWKITGSPTARSDTGETVRDTYGDYITDAAGAVKYFEPAVLVGPTVPMAANALRLWAQYSETDGGIISGAVDVPTGDGAQKTLVLIKPENFRFPTGRPGNIIDILSGSGLRIVAVKKMCLTVEQAERFYGPVKQALTDKFASGGAGRISEAMRKELGFSPPQDAAAYMAERVAPAFAETQFEQIVKFMTGYTPSECSPWEKSLLGTESCLALVYEGIDAINKIRSVLGSTDPSKAVPGSVRREFGSNIMVNAAHASDSPENVARELAIVKPGEDTIQRLVDSYYGNVVARVSALTLSLPKATCRVLRSRKSKIRQMLN